MGFKRKQDKSFQLGGLIFDNEESYRKLKSIDDSIIDIAKNGFEILIKYSSDEIEEELNDIETLKVTETYPDAYEEIDKVFPNASYYLSYEENSNCEEYKISVKFFKKIKVKHYIDY